MNTKKISSLVLAMTLNMVILHAQDAIDKYYEQYSDDPEFTSVVISSKMFELFSKIDADDPENKELLDTMSDLKGIRILSFEADSADVNPQNYKDAIKRIGREYEVLMSIDSKGEKVRFYILEDNNIINELFMIVGGEGNLFLMSIVGNIDLEKMSKLSKSMDIGGMNYLENLDNSDED